ncbi:MAG: hypothetical protein ABIK61_03480 [candidate division WOR-3 bacterium]
MKFWEKLGSIDRRIIYTIILLAVAVPLLLKIVMPIRISETVRNAFNSIEQLPPGSVVMISIDYDAASEPELQPMLIAILRHCFKKDLKVILMGHWALGLPLGEIALNRVAAEYNKKYGEDYVNLGYRPGYTALIVGIGREIRDFFSTDYRNVPIDSFSFMRKIHNYQDISLLVGLEAGATGDAWVLYAGGRFQQKMFFGATGVVAPDLYPYLQSNQITGLISGLQGAAEYETLVKKIGTGTLGMPTQSVVHGLIILFIILGNISYFVLRRRTKKGKVQIE